MNKGFTLIELIGAVVILAILSLIAFPAVVNMLNNSNNEIENNTKEIVKSATLDYLNDNKDTYPRGGNYTITVKTLMDNGYIATSIICDKCEIYNDTVSVSGNTKKYTLTYNVVNGDESACPVNCH